MLLFALLAENMAKRLQNEYLQANMDNIERLTDILKLAQTET